MSQIYRPTFVEIRLDHLKSNYDHFAGSSLGKIFLCPMVKANAYGHGDKTIVSHLEKAGCSTFGVGLVEEAIRLRVKAESRSQILVFGFTGAEAVREILHYKFIPVLSDWRQVEDLERLSTEPIDVHLKFNTGMNRLGFSFEEVPKVFEYFKTHKKFKVVGLCTHLMTSEDLADSQGASMEQLQGFKHLLSQTNPPPLLHAYNTSGALMALSRPEVAQEFPYGLRPGLGIYGLATCGERLSEKLYPVMSLKSKVVSLQKVKKGRSVSYGGTWTAPKDSVVGIVPVGYADGIPTQLSNKGQVVIDSKNHSIVGRVCMDYTLIDVSDLAQPLGKDVEFFGRQQTAHKVGEVVQTIPYDILTRISERVPRVFVEGGR